MWHFSLWRLKCSETRVTLQDDSTGPYFLLCKPERTYCKNFSRVLVSTFFKAYFRLFFLLVCATWAIYCLKFFFLCKLSSIVGKLFISPLFLSFLCKKIYFWNIFKRIFSEKSIWISETMKLQISYCFNIILANFLKIFFLQLTSESFRYETQFGKSKCQMFNFIASKFLKSTIF